MKTLLKPASFCSVAFLVGVAILVFCVLRHTDGHFIYALDDPYIHLALSSQIAQGHYGINPGEAASPSSSILWPLLLAPFAGTAFYAYVPLLWNILFGVLAAYLIGQIVSRFPLSKDDGLSPAPSWKHYVLALLLLVAANLFSLSVVGMEHVLQVLLAVCCAYAVIEALHDRPIPSWCIAAAAIAPMVRYEDLTLTLAVCMALVGASRWKTSIGLFVFSLVPIVGFSLFLKSQGLPMLPMSVLIKAGAYSHATGVARAWELLRYNWSSAFIDHERWSTLLITALFVCLTVRETKKSVRAAYLGVSLLGLLQLSIGRFGWFYRYEDYAVIFLMLLALSFITESYRPSIGVLSVAILLLSHAYVIAVIRTPTNSQLVYLQQYQMHRFVTEYYHGNYAVNDIGLTSFDRRKDSYVLDLFGLASAEAGKETNKDARWMSSMATRHNVGLVMIYPTWFQVPAADVWRPIGSLCVETSRKVSLGGGCVGFYSTQRSSDAEIRSELDDFSRTLPKFAAYHPYSIP